MKFLSLAEEDDEMAEGRRLMAEVYRDMVSEEKLARLDSQHNPFNFSERVSQTNRFPPRVSFERIYENF